MLDNIEMEMECPSCQKTIAVNSSDIGKTVKCEFCGQDILLEDGGFKESVAEANQLVDDFEKSLDKLFK